MKVIKQFYSDEPWYDLTDGGYLAPEKFCADERDIKRVNDAIDVICEYFDSVLLDEYNEDFIEDEE